MQFHIRYYATALRWHLYKVVQMGLNLAVLTFLQMVSIR